MIYLFFVIFQEIVSITLKVAFFMLKFLNEFCFSLKLRDVNVIVKCDQNLVFKILKSIIDFCEVFNSSALNCLNSKFNFSSLIRNELKGLII